MAGFKDHFSEHADRYARFRPGYPERLYDFVSGLARRRRLAWDCATGNGQSAIPLASRFDRVVATDASETQIAHAVRVEGVTYRVARAEDSGLGDHTVDLIVAAQALHWFDFDRFYDEVRRVAAAGAPLAAWAYDVCRVDPAVDRLVDELYHERVARWWPPERDHVAAGYADIPFPFEPLDAPELFMEASWSPDEMIGYLGTWSAVRRCAAETGVDPLEGVSTELRAAWGETSRLVRWPLHLRAGRVA